MKIITIGDIHGKFIWKRFVDQEADLYVFLGDYTDGYTKDLVDIEFEIYNLGEIIKFKKDNPDKVKLLLGNHDIHYFSTDFICSRFRYNKAHELSKIFYDNKDLFQVSYQIEKKVWVHGGVSSIFQKKHYKGEFISDYLNDVWQNSFNDDGTFKSIEELINEGLDHLYYIGKDRSGKDPYSGPFWVDKVNFYEKPAVGFHQIVGHNMVKEIKTYTRSKGSIITFCDCLEHNSECFELMV
jgi:predicted phosphodiesterase